LSFFGALRLIRFSYEFLLYESKEEDNEKYTEIDFWQIAAFNSRGTLITTFSFPHIELTVEEHK